MAEYDSKYSGQEVDDAVEKILTGGIGIAGEVPLKGIVIYSGLIADIPAGWALCDGTQNTPNLVGRFVMGAVTDADIGQTGGQADAVLVRHTHTVPAHTHTMTHAHTGTVGGGNHEHTQTIYGDGKVDIGRKDVSVKLKGTQYIKTSGGGHHTHTVTINTHTGNVGTKPASAVNTVGEDAVGKNLPPFVKLAYIMRVS